MNTVMPVPESEAREYLAAGARPEAPLRRRDVADMRREMRAECLALCGEPEAMAAVHQVEASGVPARLYRPAGDERTALVWIHGGGWITGDPECFDVLTRALASRTGAAVLSVDYRLAPEHTYPSAVEARWSAAVWAAGRFAGSRSAGTARGELPRYRRDGLLRRELQQLEQPGVLRPQPGQFSLNRHRILSHKGHATGARGDGSR